MKICFETEIAGFKIRLKQCADKRFIVEYCDMPLRAPMDYQTAALELGSCIMHALACDSKLDNEGD